ncbi:ORF1+2p [Medicago sativa amalgavirus 1]|uniref:ORF1+2p n=1 Tax=Medicago sativa amalgavirus 1 TaxID=2069326 RepID=UPI000DAAEF5C|nr:ORF1+2p [Medicago sativa amalgavirus 1]DAB41673.1 TPA_inf: ORF1+2p [Medicago sativa amalgavirus 1]
MADFEAQRDDNIAANAPIGGLSSKQQEIDTVTAAITPLLAAGFPQAIFNYDDLLLRGYTAKTFCDFIKPLSAITERRELISLCALGNNRFWDMSVVAELDEFLNFVKWLKSPEGRDAQTQAAKKRALNKKASDGMSTKDVALVQMGNAIIADYQRERKQRRFPIEEEMAELRRQLRQLDEELQAVEEEIKVKYGPVALYEGPDNTRVKSDAYLMYQDDCRKKGYRAIAQYQGGFEKAVELFGNKVREAHFCAYLSDPARSDFVRDYYNQKIVHLERSGEKKQAGSFAVSWWPLMEKWLLMFPLSTRSTLMEKIPVGKVHKPGETPTNRPLLRGADKSRVLNVRQSGYKSISRLERKHELQGCITSQGMPEGRIKIFKSWESEPGRMIPMSRSKYECAVRWVIGGGEVRNWKVDSSMYRGGGSSNDALKLLANASTVRPGKLLRDVYSFRVARARLQLPGDFSVPDGPDACRVKNFNNFATSGPVLKAFGVRSKNGLRQLLQDEAWWYFNSFGNSDFGVEGLPWFGARLGFRSKLVTEEKARKKISEGDSVGRAVMMMDALEQCCSSPLYNVLSTYTFHKRLNRRSGFKNAVVKASSDWAHIWNGVKDAAVIVELDWSKFDRERPREDLEFMVSLISSCFNPKSAREERLLHAYTTSNFRALVERPVFLDGGGVFGIEGMVPSGSLWTGWLDTALNILYMKAVCAEIGVGDDDVEVMCAGDDNLTLFKFDPGEANLRRIRDLLNDWFLAGISEDEFLIHRPPYHVTKVQACFPEGTDLSRGTSGMLKKAVWVPFEGEVVIDNARGRSHRWEYRFSGCPKFLSCYWLHDGLPIRPAHDNLEKLLWPEGLHDDIDVYEGAVISMVVDNPHNHHNCNHMLSRFIIIREARRLGASVEDPFIPIKHGSIRPVGDEPVPYPELAPWRRAPGGYKLEDYPENAEHIQVFRDFMQGVSSLYLREATGGVDAWQFMDIIRGDAFVGEGQFGNDLRSWLNWLHHHPISKYLRETKTFRLKDGADPDAPKDLEKAGRALRALRGRLELGGFACVEDFVRWLDGIRSSRE